MRDSLLHKEHEPPTDQAPPEAFLHSSGQDPLASESAPTFAAGRGQCWRKLQCDIRSVIRFLLIQSSLVQRRVQAARTRAKFDVALPVRTLGPAIPKARAAVNALLSIKCGRAVFAVSNRLPGTHFHAQLCFAHTAKLPAAERSRDSHSLAPLALLPHQQCVLMGDEQLAVHRNLRPSAAVHDPVVKGSACGHALPLHSLQFGRRNPRAVGILQANVR